ncbi:MAG TPA: site-2 protease family protein [bacterium]|nr:site-2 protease family protein [bacterium]HOL54752.1 site-2 protease family protein [bacterium]HOP55393.1 site-2 protease family protein [bacterium]HPO81772.1 site-2 protease family protein [bacterium]
MKGSLRIGNISGIPVEVHYTWVIVFGLITTTLATSYLPNYTLYSSPLVNWIIGAIASLILFFCVFLHEFMHSYIALKLGLKIKRITLFLFGGVAEMEGEPKSARDELFISIVGPLTSALLSLIFFLISKFSFNPSSPVGGAVIYLYRINLILAGFNIVPAFPLDGGRVLRAILWMLFKNFKKATRISAGIGITLATMIMFLGFYFILAGQLLSGLWFIFIGWFLNQGAISGEREIDIKEAFVDAKVEDLMTRDVKSVPPNITIEQLVSDYLLSYKYVAFPVMWGDVLLGIITLNDIKGLPREEWKNHTVREIMSPLSPDLVIGPGNSAFDAFLKINRGPTGRLLVMDEDKLVGIISKTDLIRFLQIKSMLTD